ncbi:hypothetical protein V6N11_069876 [Hibiscus sabdariffa]|uniref:Uncharacterized protein n=1 Tax=Hibiscus sabdariffa TaxID=183260 RepID=A0ABR2Q4R9_9ROSI
MEYLLVGLVGYCACKGSMGIGFMGQHPEVIESSYDIDCDFDGDCDNAPKEENKEDDAKEVKSIVYAGGWLLCVALEIYFSLAMWFLL